ncbi:MAG: DUF3878 family protein, partial [Clostridiales bacterium]|nr:DUF3878 family protein [Clostridiales bacterium]
LHNASGFSYTDDDYVYLSFGDSTLTYEDEEFFLTVRVISYIDDDEHPEQISEIRFKSVDVETKIYKADADQYFWAQPWGHITQLAEVIMNKKDLSQGLICDAEQKILPLLMDLYKLTDNGAYNNDFQGMQKLPLLREYIEKYQYSDVLKYIDEFEKQSEAEKKYKAKEELLKVLNKKKYEPLWRELFEIINDSQKAYPAIHECYISQEELDETHRKIEEFFNNKGYTGTYPDFCKQERMRGLRLARYGDDLSRLIGMCPAAYHIHCKDEYSNFNNSYSIQFVTGVELLKNGEQAGDIYSCMFDSKGKTYFDSVVYELYSENEHLFPWVGNLYKIMEIAVKKAEQKRLTRAERKNANEYSNTPLWAYFDFALLFGMLFAILFTPLLFLFFIPLTLLIDGKEALTGIAQDFPWLSVLLGSFSLASIGIFVMELFTDRK